MRQVKFSASTTEDISQIQNWTDCDVYHKGQNNPSWWITGNGLLSFRADDDAGHLFYVRLDGGEYCRLSVQFAPVDTVSKRRCAYGILKVLPKVIQVAKNHGSKGLIFDSSSPTLIQFMERMGFKDIGNGSFQLSFGE